MSDLKEKFLSREKNFSSSKNFVQEIFLIDKGGKIEWLI